MEMNFEVCLAKNANLGTKKIVSPAFDTECSGVCLSVLRECGGE